jgi:hypothetical protein
MPSIKRANSNIDSKPYWCSDASKEAIEWNARGLPPVNNEMRHFCIIRK